MTKAPRIAAGRLLVGAGVVPVTMLTGWQLSAGGFAIRCGGNSAGHRLGLHGTIDDLQERFGLPGAVVRADGPEIERALFIAHLDEVARLMVRSQV